MSGLVSPTASHLSGSGGCGRGAERVEDSAGSGEWTELTQHCSESVNLIFAAGSDSEAGPAALQPAGGPAGPDDRAEEAQAEDGITQLCSQSYQHRGATLKQYLISSICDFNNST